MQSQAILHFWFEELTPAQHFAQDKALDAQIAECFGNTLDVAGHSTRPLGRNAGA